MRQELFRISGVLAWFLYGLFWLAPVLCRHIIPDVEPRMGTWVSYVCFVALLASAGLHIISLILSPRPIESKGWLILLCYMLVPISYLVFFGALYAITDLRVLWVLDFITLGLGLLSFWFGVRFALYQASLDSTINCTNPEPEA